MDLTVYSRRWGHNDNYTINKTSEGWSISHLAIGGDCDRQGTPYLFENLNHDSINYPEALGEYMGWLWDKSEEMQMNNEDIQCELEKLGNWIQITERESPDGIFDEYK